MGSRSRALPTPTIWVGRVAIESSPVSHGTYLGHEKGPRQAEAEPALDRRGPTAALHIELELRARRAEELQVQQAKFETSLEVIMMVLDAF